MEQLNFKLEVYEGPLDLMLSLIAKHKLNIQDIEIAILLEQFLDYIERSREQSIELAGAFLEMAAHLLYIKTVSLLPKHEAETLKRELEGVLIEYALCKAVAELLRGRYAGDLLFTRSMMKLEVDMTYELNHSPSELVSAFSAVSYRDKLRNAPPDEDDINPALVIDYVSVYSKIVYVLKHLRKGGTVAVKTLFVGLERSSQVATFLALLELSSGGRIMFSEDMESISFG